MNYFLYLGKNLPEHVKGMGLFTLQHGFIAMVLWLLGRFVVKAYLSSRNKERFRKVLAWSIFASILPRHLTLLLTGQYTPAALPFHLCSLGIIVLVVDAHWENAVTKEISFMLTLVGAALALVFPDWADQPLWSLLTLQSFLFHALLVYYIWMRYRAREIIPRLRNIWMPAAFLGAVLPFIFMINERLGTNFFFLNAGAPGSPLELLQEAVGILYVPVLMAVVAVAWLTMYGSLQLPLNDRRINKRLKE